MNMYTTYKRQYEILAVDGDKLTVRDYANGEIQVVNKSQATPVKRKNQGELIKSYLMAYPVSSTEVVLRETGLKNPIYVNKLRKQLVK
jgi:hypothetical protein